MPSASLLRKAELTVTISGDVVNKINEIAKEKEIPGSQAIEEILRDRLLKSKKREIGKDIETYYLSLTEDEKKEDREWARISAESAKRT